MSCLSPGLFANALCFIRQVEHHGIPQNLLSTMSVRGKVPDFLVLLGQRFLALRTLGVADAVILLCRISAGEDGIVQGELLVLGYSKIIQPGTEQALLLEQRLEARRVLLGLHLRLLLYVRDHRAGYVG